MLDEGIPIKCVYGYITNIYLAEGEEDEYYVVGVEREGTTAPDGTPYPTIPMEQTVEELSSLYGPPSSLVGRRVRVDYTGRTFHSGIARVVSERFPGGGTNMNELPGRGFRYAIPGSS